MIFVQILLFGAASWMLALGFIWFGVMKLAFRGRLWPQIILGLGVVLLSGTVWLHAAGMFFLEWVEPATSATPISPPSGPATNCFNGFTLKAKS